MSEVRNAHGQTRRLWPKQPTCQPVFLTRDAPTRLAAMKFAAFCADHASSEGSTPPTYCAPDISVWRWLPFSLARARVTAGDSFITDTHGFACLSWLQPWAPRERRLSACQMVSSGRLGPRPNHGNARRQVAHTKSRTMRGGPGATPQCHNTAFARKSPHRLRS